MKIIATRPLRIASSAARLDGGLVDTVGKAQGADGEARKCLRKQGFRPAIERLRVQNDVAGAYEREDRGCNRRHAG